MKPSAQNQTQIEKTFTTMISKVKSVLGYDETADEVMKFSFNNLNLL